LLAEKILAVAANCRESPEKFNCRQFLINRIFQKNLKVLLFWRWPSVGKLCLEMNAIKRLFIKNNRAIGCAAILHNDKL
jgi:hypothetical protein